MQIQPRSVYDYDRNIESKEMMISSPPSPTPTCIQHSISKFDTLAGIAIKYGVEVAEIKKLNGLVTDSQMFALKTIDIPRHGKLPPPTGNDNVEDSPSENAPFDMFETFHSLKRKSSEQKLSPAMRSLQGHYGAQSTLKKSMSEIFNPAEYEKIASRSSDSGSLYRKSPMSLQTFTRHQKSHSVATGTVDDIMEVVHTRKSETDERKGTLIRRNNKSEANLQHIPELLMRQDNSRNGNFSARSAKGLAQRQKSASRIALTAYSNSQV